MPYIRAWSLLAIIRGYLLHTDNNVLLITLLALESSAWFQNTSIVTMRLSGELLQNVTNSVKVWKMIAMRRGYCEEFFFEVRFHFSDWFKMPNHYILLNIKAFSVFGLIMVH